MSREEYEARYHGQYKIQSNPLTKKIDDLPSSSDSQKPALPIDRTIETLFGSQHLRDRQGAIQNFRSREERLNFPSRRYQHPGVSSS